MGAVSPPNTPRRDRLDSPAHLIKSVLSNLAHPAEGFRWSDRTAQISLSPSAEGVSFNEFCPSVSLAWKVEVLLEEALREVVNNYHPRSMTLVTHLERACYSFALEAWLGIAEGAEGVSPPEDPQHWLTLLSQAVAALVEAPGKEDKDKCDAFEVDGHLAHAFADLRRRCSGSSSEMLVRMLVNLVDHTHLRRRLASLAVETVCLETVLSGQAEGFAYFSCLMWDTCMKCRLFLAFTVCSEGLGVHDQVFKPSTQTVAGHGACLCRRVQ